MSNPSDDPGQAQPKDEQGLVLLRNAAGDAGPDFDIDEDDTGASDAHALPVVVDEEEETYPLADADDEAERRTIDLGVELPSGGLDLSDLIGQLEARTARRQAREAGTPAPAAAPVTRPPAAPGTPVYDLASPAAGPATGSGEDSAAALAAANARISDLRAEIETERNNILRGRADLINARRKAEQDKERAIRESTERVIKQLLPIIDDFERSRIATVEHKSYEQLLEGVDAILRNFGALLNGHAIEPVESMGQPFDPDVHEAVGVVETDEQPEDTIVEELRKGYTSGGRLLRAALVKVVRHPSSAENAPDADEEAILEAEPAAEPAAEPGEA